MPFTPAILVVLLALAVPAPPPAVHVVVDTERAYMGSVQKMQFEYWLAAEKTWASQRGRITITRRDLGLRWRLDQAKKTFVEEKLTPPPTDTQAPAGNIHSARFDYEPEFAWTLTAAGSTEVAGRKCSRFAAEGEADYAHTALVVAIGPRVPVKTEPDVNQLLSGLARLESVSRFVRDETRKRGNGCLMSFEETQEPAIAPTIIQRVRISTLETVQPPAGIFEVPDGYTKASR